MNRAEPDLLPPDPDAIGAWPAGHRIGSFELQQVLPRTGSSRIYRAWDHALARPVAVKEYLPAELVQRDAQGRLRAVGAAAAALFERGRHVFLDESRRLARCDHPALARVLQLIEADGTAYCVMPWYAGRPLMDVPLALGGPLAEADLRVWLGDMLGALEAWHHVGGFHGGVHPGKTLLLDDGHGLLLAPGAAARITQAGESWTVPGASFQPDEQLFPGDHQSPGPWTDFHALAAVSRYAMTGQLPPPPGQGPAEPLAATLERLFWNEPSVRYSPELLRALDAAMSPDIARRPQSAGQFRRWLRDLHDTVLAPLSERPAATALGELRPLAPAAAPAVAPANDGLQDPALRPANAWSETIFEAAGRLVQRSSQRVAGPVVAPSTASPPASPPATSPAPTAAPTAAPAAAPPAAPTTASPAASLPASPPAAQEASPLSIPAPVTLPGPSTADPPPHAAHADDGPTQTPLALAPQPTGAAAPEASGLAAADAEDSRVAAAGSGSGTSAGKAAPAVPAPEDPPAIAGVPPAATEGTRTAASLRIDPPAAAPWQGTSPPAGSAAAAGPPPPAAAAPAPGAAADEEQVDAATAALIRQLIDDIPPAPPAPVRRPRAGAAAARAGADRIDPGLDAPGIEAGFASPSAASDGPALGGDAAMAGARQDDALPRPARPDLRARLRDPRLVWALAAAVALLVAGLTAWNLRPRPGLNVTSDDLPALAAPGGVGESLPRGPAAVEPPAALPPLPGTAAGPRVAPQTPAEPTSNRSRDAGPRQQCGGRTEFSLYRCMQQLCGQARWARHAQCVAFKRTDSVE